MNMFISEGDRVFAGCAVTGGVVLAWGLVLLLALGADKALFWLLFTGQLVGLAAYAGSMALLPEARADE